MVIFLKKEIPNIEDGLQEVKESSFLLLVDRRPSSLDFSVPKNHSYQLQSSFALQPLLAVVTQEALACSFMGTNHPPHLSSLTF